MSELKTSREWQKDYTEKYGTIIYDPDGWDRINFDYSWNEELISWQEFERRAMMSSQVPVGRLQNIETGGRE